MDGRIRGFLNSAQNRVKAKCPSLGAFINLLCVSDKYTWRDVGRALIGEAFDRQVLVLRHSLDVGTITDDAVCPSCITLFYRSSVHPDESRYKNSYYTTSYSFLERLPHV